LTVMDTLVTLAPLLGLLGTVTGLMKSFRAIGGEELAVQTITGGIGEALIATMCGLAIAIIALVPFNFFNGKTSRLQFELATAATRDFKPDILNISVDKLGEVYIGKTQVTFVQLQTVLSNKFKVNTNVPVYITGHKDATHGAIIHVLDVVRREGIQKVSFAITPPPAEKK